jgi:pimeloyl-ACP methyl ester carboxylesterase
LSAIPDYLYTAAVLAASQRPLAFSAAAEPSGPPAWKTIPSWYLVGMADHVLPPAQQRAMAEHASYTSGSLEPGRKQMTCGSSSPSEPRTSSKPDLTKICLS